MRRAIGTRYSPGIAVRWEGIGGIEKFAIARVNGSPKRIELSARIVDDPFDEDVVTAKAHRVCQRGSDRERASLHTTRGPVGFALPNSSETRKPLLRPPAEAISLAKNPGQIVVPNGRSKPQVDEPGYGTDVAERTVEIGHVANELADEIRRDVLRRAARGLSERERDIGREVPELGAARRLERNGGRRHGIPPLRHCMQPRRRRADARRAAMRLG